MYYRICDHVTVINETGENDIYRKFKYQFDNLLTADEIPTCDEDFEKLYVSDEAFESSLFNFLNSIRNAGKYCVGYTGIGKSTSIRHCLGLGVSNVAKLKTRSKRTSGKYMVIFPSFFDGAKSNASNSLNLTERICAVCTTLEEEHPELHSIMRTVEGRNDFYNFIRNHSPQILEVKDDFSLIGLSCEDEIIFKLSHAQKKFPYEYSASKLKFYIKCMYSLYDRLVIILDDVETLPEKYQDRVIEEYLHFYACMNNTDFPEDSNYRINLLISIRPHTLRIYQQRDYDLAFRRLEAFPLATNAVLKKSAVDLKQLFKKRFDFYTTLSPKVVGNKESWEECYKELMRLNDAFDGKYKEMILNLCFMNVRKALTVYSKIFANRFWVQGNRLREQFFTVDAHQYSFNNINVIRAIGCENSAVFSGAENSVIPNFFLSTETEDNSIHCLLVMRYFLLAAQKAEGTQDITYGQKATKLGSIREHWKKIVGSSREQQLYRALVYLFEKKILRKSIEDVDDIATLDTEESLTDQSKLYISPLGWELMAMLGRDSVLLEMLRECAWREYEGREDSYSRQSSYELLIQKEQHKIFIDLLEYIDYLREQEEKMFFDINNDTDLSSYRAAFGASLVVMHLLHGVENSLNYSGIIEEPLVSEKFARISRHINESCNMLQDSY